MVSIKLLFSLSVSILLLLNVQEATLVSQSDGSANWTDIDLSDPEHMKQAIAALSQNLIQLKEEMQRVKEEARKDTEERVNKVKEEAEVKIQNTKDQLEREMQKNKNETQKNTLTIKQIASGVTSLRPPLGADYSHSFRNSRNVDPLETFGAANYSLLEQVVRLMVPVSCYQWRQQGFDISGYYLVDPDGREVGEPPFTVYCDMVAGYTFVHHSSEGRRTADPCTGPKCYTRNIDYAANTQQILALMLRSDSCQQYVKIDCFENPLRKQGETLSTWTDRQGREQEYWAGDGDSHMCTCGMSKSCIDPRKSCNCDATVEGVTLSDQGYLSNMASLPVKSIHLGSPVDKPLQMNYTIGPLRCYGSHPVSEPRSCRDLLISGQYSSGYFFLDTEGSLSIEYCNMSEISRLAFNDVRPTRNYRELTAMKELKKELEANKEHQQTFSASVNNTFLETTIGQVKKELERYKEHQVAFSAYANHHITNTGATIVFNMVTVNVGDGYDGSTGIFTAPVDGLFYISVHLQKTTEDDNFEFLLQKNGILITGAWVDTVDVADNIQVGISIVEMLEVGDEIKVKLHEGRGWYYHKGSRFNGFLLK